MNIRTAPRQSPESGSAFSGGAGLPGGSAPAGGVGLPRLYEEFVKPAD